MSGRLLLACFLLESFKDYLLILFMNQYHGNDTKFTFVNKTHHLCINNLCVDCYRLHNCLTKFNQSGYQKYNYLLWF